MKRKCFQDRGIHTKAYIGDLQILDQMKIILGENSIEQRVAFQLEESTFQTMNNKMFAKWKWVANYPYTMCRCVKRVPGELDENGR